SEKDSEDGETDDLLGPAELGPYEERQTDDHRPDEIELFFDGQRPEMLDRRRSIVRSQIVDAGYGEVPVDDVEASREDLASGIGPDRLWSNQEGCDPNEEEDKQRCWKQPPDPSRPELCHIAPTPWRGLDEVAGDQEPGDDEKYVNTDEPADESIGPQVIEQNDTHGQSAQPLDIGTKARRFGRARSLRRVFSDGGCRLHQSATLSFSVGWFGPDCGPCHYSFRSYAADSMLSGGLPRSGSCCYDAHRSPWRREVRRSAACHAETFEAHLFLTASAGLHFDTMGRGDILRDTLASRL